MKRQTRNSRLKETRAQTGVWHHGVNPVNFLIDFFESSTETLLGTDEVIEVLEAEGFGEEEIDTALNDPKLDSYYEPRDDAWGISEVPYAGPGDGSLARGLTSFASSQIEENKVRITKRQLRRIIKEEKAKLLKEQGMGLQNYRVTMLIALPPGQEEYILPSIQDGMELDEAAGEGILEYDVRPEGV